VMLTDPRYTLQAKRETERTGVRAKVVKGALEPGAAAVLEGAKRIGFEDSRVRYGVWSYLDRNLGKGCRLIGVGDPVGLLRMVKSGSEIAAIRKSVMVNSRAYAGALAGLRPGMTEKALAGEIEYRMRLEGAEKPSFETIVAFGANSALPHAQPGETKIAGNGILLIDMGTMRGGYASDMTRCVHLGNPGAKARKLYSAVLEAQQAALEAVKPGARGGDVDGAARKVLRRQGFGAAFVHSTGHGLGLEIHEAPRLGRGDETELVPGMVITIEPGAYLAGFGGVRIEDTVVVTRDGREMLTPTSKEFSIF
jgi:Xaa-Pro aminopeptidase